MGKTILVVDDDAAIRDSLRTTLEHSGFIVWEAGGAIEAEGRIKQERPDLVITDIYMPQGDGFELLRELGSVDLPIPVVVMSGGFHSGFNQLDLASKLGAVAIIEKPFRPEVVLETVDRVLGGRDAR